MNQIYIELMECIHQLKKKNIVCIGFGVPGLLDIEKGISLFSPNFPLWKNVPVVDWLEQRVEIPVFIDNDVRMNLYGEWYLGAGRGKQNIVLLALGTGLGAGIVVDGRVLYGNTASAGEIGHMNMYREGRECRCGSSGCLGRYVSALGILRTFKEKLAEGKPSIVMKWVDNKEEDITVNMLSEAFDAGDRAAIEAMQETGELLGYGLVNVINLFNPEMIIIGGGVSRAGERLLSSARAVIRQKALQISQQQCEICVAQLGDGVGMAGAAVYARQRWEKELTIISENKNVDLT